MGLKGPWPLFCLKHVIFSSCFKPVFFLLAAPFKQKVLAGECGLCAQIKAECLEYWISDT